MLKCLIQHLDMYACCHYSEGYKLPFNRTDNVYNCIYCSFSCAELTAIQEHMKVDHDTKPKYRCLLLSCKKGFHDHASLFMKRANIASGKNCLYDISGLVLPNSISGRKPDVNTADEDELHECSVCKKTYQSRKTLQIHMQKIHLRDDAKICDVCGKTFANRQNLELHYRSHTGYKPFQCQYCTKSFTDKRFLVNHERIHTGEKPFVCEHCGKAFGQQCTLVHHTRIHTGERPYVCHICNKGFVARALLNVHLKSCKGSE